MLRSIPPRSALLVGLGSLLALGCRTSSTPAEPHELVASDPGSTSASSSRAAFVVLTADHTMVIPIDPALPVKTLPGHWVGAPSGPVGGWATVEVELTTKGDPQRPTLPVCPTRRAHACKVDLESDEADPKSALASASGSVYAKSEVVAGQPQRWRFTDDDRGDDPCTCVVVDGLSTDGPVIDLDAPDVQEAMANSGYSEQEYLDNCSEEHEPDFSSTSYLGGVLYQNGLYTNANCSGYNLIHGATEEVPLRPGAAAPQHQLDKPMVCRDQTVLDQLELVAMTPDALECEPGEQMEAFKLHRGRLVRLMGSTEGPEVAGCSCASWTDASAASCPSPLDPCGQGRELPDRDQWEELWVTNDERLALVERNNELVVLAVAGGAPVRTVPSKDPILGVEHHPMSALLDAVPPPEGIRVAIPELHATDASFKGSAKAWGNRCFEHLQADRLDAAEAACFAGLLTRGTNGTRGALTYNLGRIAEARGDKESAREYYERSQKLRPSDATAKRLRALGGA